MKITYLTPDTIRTLQDSLLKRSPNYYAQYADRVQNIIDDVKENGDEALFRLTRQFDGAEISASNIRVTPAEIEAAYSYVDPELVEVIRRAISNIRSYHEKQEGAKYIYAQDAITGEWSYWADKN